MALSIMDGSPVNLSENPNDIMCPSLGVTSLGHLQPARLIGSSEEELWDLNFSESCVCYTWMGGIS